MRLEIYAPRASAVHALHPVTKLWLLVVAIAGPIATMDPTAQVVALLAALAAAAAGRVVREVLAPWKLLAFIFLVTFGLWALFGGDGIRANLRSGEALGRAALPALAYGLRVTAIFIFGLVFLATTRIEEAIQALEMSGVPYRIAFALGLAFRLVPLFLQSAESILDAQRARGLDLRSGGLGARLRKQVPVLVPIFMTSLRSADQMAMALDARGFGAGVRRTRYRAYPFGRADLAALALGAAYAALFVAATIGAGGGLTSVPR